MRLSPRNRRLSTVKLGAHVLSVRQRPVSLSTSELNA